MPSTTLPALFQSGLASARPLASAVGSGALYYSTDTFLLEQSDGSSWSTWADFTATTSAFQPLDSDLTSIAGLTPSDDDVIQRKSGAWAKRTLAQLMTDLAALGTTFQPLDSDLTAIAALSTTSYGRSLLTLADVAALYTALSVDTDTALTANSDTKIPSQKAVKAYADGLIAANDAMVFKGVTDCSGTPNYPAASRGDTYRVSVAGKIGGASGTVVEVGDLFICLDDGTSSGTQAAQGSHWTIVQTNIDGAVTGPASSTASDFATFSGTSGKVIQDSGVALDTDTALAANSDSKIASQKATKAYVDAQVAAPGTALTAAPSSDTTANGITVSLTAGETLAFGDPVYIKSDGKMWKADANGSSTYPAVGIAVSAAAGDAAVTILLLGYARNDAWAWTVGGIVYLSTSAGLTQTQPSATDDVIQVIGMAPHADRLYVNPQLVYITHT